MQGAASNCQRSRLSHLMCTTNKCIAVTTHTWTEAKTMCCKAQLTCTAAAVQAQTVISSSSTPAAYLDPTLAG
jgi:hypothetical protein